MAWAASCAGPDEPYNNVRANIKATINDLEQYEGMEDNVTMLSTALNWLDALGDFAGVTSPEEMAPVGYLAGESNLARFWRTGSLEGVSA